MEAEKRWNKALIGGLAHPRSHIRAIEVPRGLPGALLTGPADERLPENEYLLRLGRVKAAMAEAGIDTLCVADPASLNYLTGYDGVVLLRAPVRRGHRRP